MIVSGAIVLFVLGVLFIFFATSAKDWHKATPFGVGALALIAGAGILASAINKPPAPASDIGLTGRDSYQVMLEEKTTTGKTLVVVRDSSGKFYASEFDEPLGVAEILVVSKERFKPLLWPESKPLGRSQTGEVKSEKATSDEAAQFLK